MCVIPELIPVPLMPLVLTLLSVLCAYVIQGLWEMGELRAQVSFKRNLLPEKIVFFHDNLQISMSVIPELITVSLIPLVWTLLAVLCAHVIQGFREMVQLRA